MEIFYKLFLQAKNEEEYENCKSSINFFNNIQQLIVIYFLLNIFICLWIFVIWKNKNLHYTTNTYLVFSSFTLF